MSSFPTQVKSLGLFLAQKRSEIENHLKLFLPVVIISREEGVYVFSNKNKSEKVYSTIVAAGAGRAFGSVCEWFRGQLKELSLLLSRRDPRAIVEIRILPKVFYPNIVVGGEMIYADIVLAEIGSTPAEDFVARVDYLGKETFFKEPGTSNSEKVTVVSYKNIRSDEGGNGYYGKRGGGVERNPEDDQNDFDSEGVGSGAESEKSREDKYRKNIRKEFSILGLFFPDDASDDEQVAKFLSELKEKWPGKKCFLDRSRVQKKEFDWVYKEI